ncbi:MAG: GNAT family N-acetyltransferase [Bauldia sp.]
MSAEPTSIRRLAADDTAGWAAMRCALFPDEPPATLAGEIAGMLADPKQAAFVALRDGRFVGFIEAGERSVAEGAWDGPVAYIEALWVDDTARHQGVARLLVEAVKAWAIFRGYRDLASDVQLHNTLSQTVHDRLGFTETERLVTYLMRLDGEASG